MRSLLTLSVIALTVVASWAQTHSNRCYTTEAMSDMELRYPGYTEAVNRTFEEAKRHSQQQLRNDEIYLIPVVFHIVYNTENGNLPDSVIESQLDVLNEDFRRWNADAALTREEFLPVAADAGIQFVFASTDPDGNPTTGITRTQTSQTSWISFSEFIPNNIKRSSEGGVDAWDTELYLNIWVGDLSFLGAPFILGFAYPPVGADNWPDGSNAPDPTLEGVVIHNAVLGRNNPLTSDILATNTKGRTCTHEVGHYLGLRHTWGDGGGFSGVEGCSVDDGIEDTPNCAEAQQQLCNLNSNSCVDEPIDHPDMIENYMDYSDESCQNMFTQQQVDVMRGILATSRNELVDVIPAGVNDLDKAAVVSAYPNPASERMTFSSTAPLEAINILDLSGRMVQRYDAELNGGTMGLDVSILMIGTYLLHAEGPSMSRTMRIVIQR